MDFKSTLRLPSINAGLGAAEWVKFEIISPMPVIPAEAGIQK
jgi:hypothetical protein